MQQKEVPRSRDMTGEGGSGRAGGTIQGLRDSESPKLLISNTVRI